jgi:hypothetical protein
MDRSWNAMQEEGVGTQRMLSKVESPRRTRVGWGEGDAIG